MDCSTPGFPVHHPLAELTQTHVPLIGDAIQPSHPLSFPSPPAISLPKHQNIFQWVSSSHQVAKGLEFELQLTLKTLSLFKEYSGLISFRIDWLNLLAVQGILKSLLPTPQLKSINSLEFSFLYGPTVTSIHDYWKNHSFDLTKLDS